MRLDTRYMEDKTNEASIAFWWRYYAEETMDINGGYVPVLPKPVFPSIKIVEKVAPFVAKVTLKIAQMLFWASEAEMETNPVR